MGIVCIAWGDNSIHRQLNSLKNFPEWNNPEVKGFLIRASWEVIEPVEGNFDFSYFDLAVQLAREHHKFLGLCVVAGRQSPQWLYQAGAQKLTITRPHGRSLVLPLPWDPIFQKKWSALITAFGKKYDEEPLVAYVDMSGPGRDIETFFVSEKGEVAAFEQSGGHALWGQAAMTIAGFYANAFPHTPFLYALGPPTPDVQGHHTLEGVVNSLLKKYPRRFGLASNALTPNYYPPPPSALMIAANSDATTVGFQMALPDKDGTNMQGSLEDALKNGLKYKAHFIEVYPFDCNDPIQQAPLHQANQSLLKKGLGVVQVG